jgi:hypothetical protein
MTRPRRVWLGACASLIVSTGAHELCFDADGATYAMRRADGTYHLNVATPGSWAGTVRTFTVEFTDGQRFSAPFAFR